MPDAPWGDWLIRKASDVRQLIVECADCDHAAADALNREVRPPKRQRVVWILTKPDGTEIPVCAWHLTNPEVRR